MAPVILLRGGNAASNARTHAAEAFARLEVDALDVRDAGSVESRLRHLEVEFASIDSRLQRARDRDVERQDFQSQLNGLAAAEASLEERRKHLQESIKLDSMTPDAELVDSARALDRLRETRIEHQGAVGLVDEFEARRTELLSRLADVLQRHGEPIPKDATTARAYLDNLADRNVRWVQALADERRTQAQLEQLSVDRDAARSSIGAHPTPKRRWTTATSPA